MEEQAIASNVRPEANVEGQGWQVGFIAQSHGCGGLSLGLELPLRPTPDTNIPAKMCTGFFVRRPRSLDERVLFAGVLPRQQKSGTAFRSTVPAEARRQEGLPWI